MKRISDSLRDIIKNQPFLLFGYREGLFNLSQLARLLRPYVEIRTKKDVKETAILMNLSRMQKKFAKSNTDQIKFRITNVAIQSNLCTVTYYNNPPVNGKLSEFYNECQKRNEYVVLNKRPSEVTIITTEKFFPQLGKAIKEKPKFYHGDLSAIAVQFEEDQPETPGIFYFLTQQLALQGINIWEISSCFSEIIFYIDQKDMSVAFSTMNTLMEKENFMEI